MRLSAGFYFGRPISSESYVTHSPIKGEVGTHPAFEICFRVLYRKQRGDLVELDKPQKRTARLFLTEKAREFSLQKLEAMGFSGDFERPAFKDDLVLLRCDYVSGRYERWSVCLPEAPRARPEVARELTEEMRGEWR